MARRGENIRKRKDGRWEGRYLCQADGGKTKLRSVYAKTYREVKEKLEDARQKAKAELPVQLQSVITMAEIAEDWLTEVREQKKYSTYVKYRQLYEKYLRDRLADQTAESLTQDYLENDILPKAAFLLGKGKLSESLKNEIYCILRQVLKHAARKYHETVNNIDWERRKTMKSPVEIFSLAEQERLIAYLSEDMDIYRFGVILCLYTGLRIGELCALKWSDIDMENRILRVSGSVQRLPVSTPAPDLPRTALMESEPKSLCSRREIPICDGLYPLLIRFHHSGKYVIGNEKVTDPRTYQKKFTTYLRDAEIEHRSFHTLRHTFASNCVACGTDAKALSEILGHSNVQMTLNRYVHPSIKTKRTYLNKLYTDLNGQKMGQAV